MKIKVTYTIQLAQHMNPQDLRVTFDTRAEADKWIADCNLIAENGTVPTRFTVKSIEEVQ
jgi:hypothetical protein